MKNLYLWLLIVLIIVVCVVVVSVIFFQQSPSSIIDSIISGSLEGEKNTETSTNASVSQTENISNETGNDTEGTGAGGFPGSSDKTQRVNYTLNVDSFPEGLQVLTNYTFDNGNLVLMEFAPYEIQIESGTRACVLLTSPIKGGSVIKWELDGEECPPFLCSGFMGCGMTMDRAHRVIVYYSTPG